MAQVDSENSTAMPAEDAGPLFRRTDISPEDFFQALGRARKAARDEIEKLIEWLDSTIDVDEDTAIDDDRCDGEGDDEPSLGSCDRISDQVKAWKSREWMGAGIDCELDGSDDEPSLGFLEPEFSIDWYTVYDIPCLTALLSQSSWHMAQGGGSDREDEFDGREPDVDAEPSLCGTAEMAGANGGDKDLEGEDFDREPSLGWTIDGCVTATNYEGCDRELAAEPGREIISAAYDRPPAHDKTDHSGRHVDVDDMRIGTRKIRNLSPKQEKLLAPRIDRSEVRI